MGIQLIKTFTIQKRGKLNPKFLLSLNQTVEETNNGEKNTTYKLWYLTVTMDEHGKFNMVRLVIIRHIVEPGITFSLGQNRFTSSFSVKYAHSIKLMPNV